MAGKPRSFDVEELVLDEEAILEMMRVMPTSRLTTLLRAALVWRRTTNKMGRVVGGAVASFIQYNLAKGKSEAWILANYKTRVRQVLKAHLLQQLGELEQFFDEMSGLRSRRGG